VGYIIASNARARKHAINQRSPLVGVERFGKFFDECHRGCAVFDPGVFAQALVMAGAGVDHLFSDPDLPDVPIVRFVDPDLTGRMVEYIALHVLYRHWKDGGKPTMAEVSDPEWLKRQGGKHSAGDSTRA